MSDRKYRQRGYQDEPRDREPAAKKPVERERAPGRPLQDASGPKTPNLMATHEVFRCARCGNRLPLPVETASRCTKCGTELHSCVQCASFDTSARFECARTELTARVSPKDSMNFCTLFTPRTTIERQTGAAGTASGPSSARQAFDDLFK
jgi:hypothetical protein